MALWLTSLDVDGKEKLTRFQRKIVRMLDKEPQLTSKQVQAALQSKGTTVSTRTIRRRLNDKGLYGRRPRKTPLLTPRPKKAKLEFAKTYLKKPKMVWEHVLWSDETKWWGKKKPLVSQGRHREGDFSQSGRSAFLHCVSTAAGKQSGDVTAVLCFPAGRRPQCREAQRGTDSGSWSRYTNSNSTTQQPCLWSVNDCLLDSCKGQEPARRSTLLDSDEIVSYYYDDCRTVYEVFQRGLRVSISQRGSSGQSEQPQKSHPIDRVDRRGRFHSVDVTLAEAAESLAGVVCDHTVPGKNCVGHNRQVSDRAEYLGSALLNRGCKPSSEQFIGIFAQNRPETNVTTLYELCLQWIITELCCYTYSMVAVPLYDTLGAEAITYIITKAEISVVFCDNTEKAKLLLASVENGETSSLRTVVLMDPFDEDLVERGKKCGVEIVSLRDMEEEGKNHHERPKPPKPEDLAVVCFTSGTTGNPKGAMLSHKNIVSNSAAFLKVTEELAFPSTQDVVISFLPLAHMFERVVESLLTLNASDIHVSYLPLAHMFERLVQEVIKCPMPFHKFSTYPP
ncbi:unnamed protein product [Ranitomeya imitator]|uniref:long-chain-fatty-acid--CoA ligase n=1 Tax=Ranitomeya imitator TaxID=111125 RepID=A0ABN9LDI1_9NEOB|nr:unnamed protein product [Ranitomeya imitator]